MNDKNSVYGIYFSTKVKQNNNNNNKNKQKTNKQTNKKQQPVIIVVGKTAQHNAIQPLTKI